VQVAGRAGRYFPDGKVIVQTFRPGEPAVALACSQDIEGFYSYELEQRRLLGFPPYARLIRVVFRSRDPAKAERASRSLAGIIRKGLSAEVELLGPQCPYSECGNSRRQLILRAVPSFPPMPSAPFLARIRRGREAAPTGADVDR
jgi:primosomal protein N' (replication factor Y)